MRREVRRAFRSIVTCVACWIAVSAIACAAGSDGDGVLPPGVYANWDMSQAHREATATRERICINGLWRWQPADAGATDVPASGWGYFKVPGSWPGTTSYMQKDSQTAHAHPSWQDRRLSDLTAAWYEREIAVPASWSGRRTTLCLEYLNSFAAVYIDGEKAGQARFPAGQVDLTGVCEPGRAYRLTLLVEAMPLKGVMLSYTDTASAREVEGTVARRGLCGDVYLVGMPAGPRIADVRVATSVRNQEFSLDLALEGLTSRAEYGVRTRILEAGQVVKEFSSRPLRGYDVHDGRVTFTESWMPEKLWDIHTPDHMYAVEVSLLDDLGRLLDAGWTVPFGFREFWIDGRDFYLNGTRIGLSAVPLDNAQVGAALATYQGACESMRRLKSFGINFVYTHNYGCEPGSHLSFAEILDAADEMGMLVSLSQPHFSHYDWQSPDADENNGYARHAAFYVRAAQNHPSVVTYAMSHNATGYSEDMNPDMIDGIQHARDTWASRNAERARRAEAIVRALDPSRIVYHHASGNLGALHAINFYPNFVPIQEMSDWFEHWASEGVKPVFLCEYGTPFTWDWSMYRGWYEGEREFGSAAVPWEFCLAEWNAQFFGDRAFDISEMEKRNLRWEARQFREGRLWHRWDYPHRLGSTDLPEREPVFAKYFTENWRAFRTWGVSAASPWEHHILYKLRPGVERNRREDYVVDWANLQRPGFSPDYQQQRYERFDLAYEASDWVATGAGEAIIRNNRPLLAYLAGKPGGFTSKDHNFRPGETIEKQIVVINNSREKVTCECRWLFGPSLPPMQQDKTLTVAAGQQERVPLRIELPGTARPGTREVGLTVRFNTGECQTDSFAIHILPQASERRFEARVALFDPQGQTRALLSALGIETESVQAEADVSGYDILVVGKGALTVEGPAPDIAAVRDGMKVVVFEQKPDVLEKRFGFRIAAYGLRNVFRRVPDHPILSGLRVQHLRDWRGEATLLPPRLEYERHPKFNNAPTVQWCGIPVTRAWRCGNRGNVASVLIEKPACGDFLPIVDGGFSLQYSPLIEYREGKGMVLFCQLDVTGRTEADPAAVNLTGNLLTYAAGWKPLTERQTFYAGAPAVRQHLEAAGFRLHNYEGHLDSESVLVLGPAASESVAFKEPIKAFLAGGGRVLALGLTQSDVDAVLPFLVSMREAEQIGAFFNPPGLESTLAGVGPADVHNRAPRIMPLVADGADGVGDGVLATAQSGRVVFCQLTPWQFEYRDNYGLKRTFRRSSFLVTRLLANLGVRGRTPLLERFATPVGASEPGRWRQGFYLDAPQEWDDPYRFFRW